MTEEELRALLRRGENQRTEFKAADADAADIAQAIVAMANSGGGSILLGVGDDGELLGLWYAQPRHITRHIRTMPDLAAWRQWVVIMWNLRARKARASHSLVAGRMR